MQRAADAAAQRETYAARSSRLSNARLVLFVLALATLLLGIANANWWLLGGAALLFGAFIWAVARHTDVDREQRHYADLQAINHEGSARVQRHWNDLPSRQADVPQPAPAIIADLDLLGHASLGHLLNTAYTSAGQTTLRDWLLQPATPAIIAQRQTAVAELAPLRDFRDGLNVRGRSMGAAQANYEQFLAWAEREPWLLHRPWMIWLAWVMPLIFVATVVLQVLGWVRFPLWVVVIAANQLFSSTAGKPVDAILSEVAARQSIFRTYADLFAHVNAQVFSAPELQRLQHALTANDLRADRQMRRLSRIMAFADLRLSMLYPVVQLTTLWSVHVLWRLERWQRVAGPHARRWLLAMGEIEALTALATLAHDHPDWTFPTMLTDAAPQFVATGLMHPLLRPAVARPNDVQIGPPGTFLLITGSNMSGKSTLLRAIGLNVVLAQAGGPVAAEHLALTPTVLGTSIRVQDSLEQGVSYYMAELQRLKQIVDEAERLRSDGQRTLLFLLDEILHGTNTSERQIAARRIIRHLVAQDAIGVVSTHDLTLADAPDLAQISQPYYFTEDFRRGPDGPVMSFDYTLRPGLAVSTNALKLMEIVGLPLDGEQASGIGEQAASVDSH